MYAAGSHDVLVMDHSLPGYDGLELIRTQASRDPLPPAVIVTSTGDEETAVETMKQGAGDYVVRHLEARYLDLPPAVIEQVLEQRRLAEEKQQAQLQRDAALEDLQQARGGLTVLYARLREARDQLGYLLHRFVPEQLARKPVMRPRPPKPGGERPDASILFADVRDFNATAEALEPEAVLEILSDQLRVVTEAIKRHQGTLVQYVADMVMGAFNVPDDQPDHPQRAALDLRDSLERFAAERETSG
jgi:CheY-like chemotaxis protein